MLEKLKQRSTWLGIFAVAVPLLQIVGVEFNPELQESIATTLAAIAGIALIWINPK